MDSHENGQ
ncbi:hypothetical protein CIB84_004277 [Bambusicola thoracicus]|uniref:Uncharacterized protein n=1 Tax=Bambusicola thoracicus TaxID=9083 RepID=A0A2P4T6H0_BAMTH|nr:hypothetical protein CIB84_004277 [Bambusicola thoracicus]